MKSLFNKEVLVIKKKLGLVSCPYTFVTEKIIKILENHSFNFNQQTLLQKIIGKYQYLQSAPQYTSGCYNEISNKIKEPFLNEKINKCYNDIDSLESLDNNRDSLISQLHMTHITLVALCLPTKASNKTIEFGVNEFENTYDEYHKNYLEYYHPEYKLKTYNDLNYQIQMGSDIDFRIHITRPYALNIARTLGVVRQILKKIVDGEINNSKALKKNINNMKNQLKIIGMHNCNKIPSLLNYGFQTKTAITEGKEYIFKEYSKLNDKMFIFDEVLSFDSKILSLIDGQDPSKFDLQNKLHMGCPAGFMKLRSGDIFLNDQIDFRITTHITNLLRNIKLEFNGEDFMHN